MSTRAANPKARYDGAGGGTTSMVRDIGKINCTTYPIDFNPWTLYTRFRTQMTLPAKKDRDLLIPLNVLLDFIFLAQWNTIHGKFHGSRFRGLIESCSENRFMT